MKRNLSILIALLASASCCDAQTVVNPALVPILEASEKPFPDLVKTFIAAPLPALPLPSSGTSNPTLVVSQLLWKRLASLDVVITKGNKPEALEALESMCALREWLLKRDAYTNLLFSSYIEETVSMSVLAALSDKLISVDEARQLMNQMKKAVALSEVIAVIEMVTPQSAPLRRSRRSRRSHLRFWTSQTVYPMSFTSLWIHAYRSSSNESGLLHWFFLSHLPRQPMNSPKR